MFDRERKALTNVLNHMVDEIDRYSSNEYNPQAHSLYHDITCLQEYLATTTREEGSRVVTIYKDLNMPLDVKKKNHAKAYGKEWRKNNKEKIAKRMKAYYLNNKEKYNKGEKT